VCAGELQVAQKINIFLLKKGTFLKIHVTATCNELLRDGLKPINGRDVERCGPTRALVVDEGLRAFCRQQPSNLPIFTMTRGRPKLLPQHF
jgi:hypothetical protein